MRAIIVDDEPRAISLLEKYLQHFAQVEVVGTFRNGLKALEFLSGDAVDLIFLDINMPHLSGISLSKMVGDDTRVIFTTAYSEYAVESYEVEAADYLLKPITFERFARAMGKVLEQRDQKSPEQSVVLVKSGSRLHRINPGEIVYLEKAGNYITYFLVEGKVLGRATVDEAIGKLPSQFVRVHKSYVVNGDFVRSMERSSLNVDGVEIPVGSSFHDDVKRQLFG